MTFIPVIMLIIFLLFYKFTSRISWSTVIFFSLASIIISLVVVFADIDSQTIDTEVWSGKITSVNHKEEWDEWIPPKTETYIVKKEVNGKTIEETKTRIIPGHWDHHYAKNWLETSDYGVIYLSESPDGKKFNDSWPNKVEELHEYWKVGDPSASVHTYRNKVQASYSLYKHKEINLKQYKDLPKYPTEVSGYTSINRIIGSVPNKEQTLKLLAQKNTELNKSISDPDNPGKKRSWKQVNIIFVNVGENKTEDYGFALQDYWENGNKNDFVISFSMNSDGKLNWVYPFSWSESEILKLHVRDYMLDLNIIKDFSPIVEKTSEYVAKEFTRKQFADFNYLQVEISKTANTFIFIFNIVLFIMVLFTNSNNEITKKTRWR